LHKVIFAIAYIPKTQFLSIEDIFEGLGVIHSQSQFCLAQNFINLMAFYH